MSAFAYTPTATGDLIEVEVAEQVGVQLPEAGAVSVLRPRLQGWQIIVGEAFQSFLVGSAGISTTVEPMMLIKKTGEELLSGGFRGGVGGSPDFRSRATGNAPNRSICAYRRSPLAADPMSAQCRTERHFCKQNELIKCGLTIAVLLAANAVANANQTRTGIGSMIYEAVGCRSC